VVFYPTCQLRCEKEGRFKNGIPICKTLYNATVPLPENAYKLAVETWRRVRTRKARFLIHARLGRINGKYRHFKKLPVGPLPMDLNLAFQCDGSLWCMEGTLLHILNYDGKPALPATGAR